LVDEEKVREVYRIGYNDCKNIKSKMPSATASILATPSQSKFLRYAPYDEAYRQGWCAASKDWDEDLGKVIKSIKSKKP